MARQGSHHDAIRVIASVPRKFLSVAETGGTDVDTVAGLADGICAFDSDGVGEIAAAAVALDLETRLRHGWWRASAEEIGEEGRRALDFFGWLSLAVSDGHWMSPEKEGGDRIQIAVPHLTGRPPGEGFVRGEDEKIKNLPNK